MRRLRWMGGVGAALLLIGAAEVVHGARDGPVEVWSGKAQPTMAALATPEAVLAPVPDKNAPYAELRLTDGIVLTGMSPLSFDPQKKEQSITLAGTRLTFTMLGSKQFEMSCNGRKTKLEPRSTANSFSGYKPVTVKIGDGREYILAFPYGGVYESRPMIALADGNIQQGEAQLHGFLCYRSGCVQQFTAGGQTVCLFDSNCDGVYNLPDDGIGVGAPDAPMQVFGALNQPFATAGGVYEVTSVAADGSEISFRQVRGTVGAMSVGFSAGELRLSALFRATDSNVNATLWPGRTAASAAMLPGSSGVVHGLVYSPQSKKVVASVIGGRLSAQVRSNATTDLALGAPLKLDFLIERDGDKVNVHSKNFHLTGKAGEEYTNFSWKAQPQLSLVNGNRTVEVGKMEFG